MIVFVCPSEEDLKRLISAAKDAGKTVFPALDVELVCLLRGWERTFDTLRLEEENCDDWEHFSVLECSPEMNRIS